MTRRAPRDRARTTRLPGVLCALLLSLALVGCRADSQARRLLQEADAAIARQQWEVAQARAAAVAGISGVGDALRDQARLREEQARAEVAARALYVRFQGSAESDPDSAIQAYRELPQTSYYRAQAREAYERLRPAYVAAHLEKARNAILGHRCDEGKAQLQLVLDIDPANAVAIGLGKLPACQPAP